MATRKSFHPAVLYAVISGILTCDMGDIYDILGHITGHDLWTIHLPSASDFANSTLRMRHPDIAQVKPPNIDKSTPEEDRPAILQAWRKELEEKFGTSVMVSSIDGWRP